jgi:hypothetical protein
MRRLLPLCLLAGCSFESWKYKSYPPNPYADVQTVVVLPAINQTLEPRFDGLEFGNLLASELVKFEGFRVVRPLLVQASLAPGQRILSVDDAIRAGKGFKADAVLAVAVTDCDPYDPPRIGVSLQFLRVQGRELSGADIDRLVQSASWRRGPFPMGREKAGHFMDAFEDVYDAHEERIRREVRQYAHAQEAEDTPFAGEREFLAVQPRWLQFVSNQLLNRLFDRALAAAE